MKFFKKRAAKNAPRVRPIDASTKPKTTPVFSYHTNRLNSDSQDERGYSSNIKKPTRKWLHHTPTVIALVVVIGAVIYSLTLTTYPKVVILGDSSTMLRGNAEVYQKSMQNTLSSSLFNRSKLTMDTINLANKLKQEYPEFSDISVVLPILGRRPVIQVQPSQTVAVLENEQGKFLIDSTGKAAFKLDNWTNNPDVPTLVDETGLEVKEGDAVLPLQTLKFIQDMQDHFKSKGKTVNSMTLPALANELHVRLSDQPYFIKLNIENDVREQVGTFIALEEKLAKEGPQPKEYVDVRVEEKAFYR